MEKETFPIKKAESTELTFPENSGLVIEKILEKYGFKEEQEKGIEKFLESKIPTERKEIFENLPGSKIARLVKEYTISKISLKDLPPLLEKKLNISRKKAGEMAKELEKKLLIFIKPIKEEIKKEEVPSPKIPSVEAKPPAIPSEKPKPEKPDIYRESIE